jgi:translocation and assembly module TamB
MSRPMIRWRKAAKYCAYGVLLFLVLVSGALWYVTTDSFQQMVRGRLTAEIERVTGGRVKLGSFRAVPLRFQVEVRDLTIHGREAAGEVPYVHVDSMSAIINISSALGAKIGFHSLTLDHPVVHVIFYPDGSTNQPGPKQTSTDFEQLFSFSVARLDVRRGELLWQDKRLPLEFSTNDVSARLNYSFIHRRYSGTVAIGRAETQFDGYRPVAWKAQSAFAIERNGIQVQSLNVAAEHSQLEASGLVSNFLNPALKGNYHLDLDLGQLAAISRQSQVKSGNLVITGNGSWSSQTFASSGKFETKDAAWQDKNFSARNLAAAGNFSLGPQKISLSHVEGRALGGAFTSEAELINWQTPAKPLKGSNTEERGVIKIKGTDVSLSELLSSLGPQFRPVNKLKLAAALSGTSEIRWRSNFRNAEITAALDLSRPTRSRASEIPADGSMHFSYRARSGEVQIADLSLNTPASQVRASGAMPPSSALRLSFATTDFREWQPVIAELFPSGLPVLVHGRAAFTGTASGKFSNPTLVGNLQLQDFETSLQLNTFAPETQVHWDSLSADVQASSRTLAINNAVLRRGDETVKGDGNATLLSWKLTGDSPFHLHLDIQNMDAGELAALEGYDHNLSGKVSTIVELSGTAAKPEGQARVSGSNVSIRGHVLDTASALLVLNGSQVAFRELQLARKDAHVSGSGNYDLSSHALQLDLNGKNFDLADFSQVEASKIQAAGKLDFSAHASGTLEEPTVTANLRLRDLVFNEEAAGNFSLDAVSHGPDVRLTGHSDSRNAELLVDGTARLRDRWPAHIDFHFTRLDVDPFLESYLRGHVTGHSAVAGDLLLEGPLRDPQRLNLAGNLTDFYAELQKIKLRNDGPIRFNLSESAVKFENFHILGENTDFSGSGTAMLAGDHTLDFQGRGKVDLHMLQTYDPDLASSGTLTGAAHVTGTLDAPQVRGSMEVQNGALADINLPNALTEINGTLLFSQNQITIQRLTARTGGGTVAFTGHAEIAGKQINFDLTASANDVRLRYPPGVSSTADADLHWSGSSSGSQLSGDITITKLGFTPGFDFGAYLQRAAQVSSLPQTDPLLNSIHLDLHVVTTPELQMQTSVVRLQGEADLHVRGNAAKPVLLGRADVFEGEAYLNGTKYRLERGGVTFTNPAITTPFVDLEAITRIRDYDITLSLSGDVSKSNGLKTNYRSDPPLPTADIITLLAFGQTTEESAQLQQANQSAFSQQASNAMLAAALNATLNNRAQRLFGNSRIKIDPQGLTTETSTTQSGPAVSIEQQVKDNLTITYTTNVSQTSQQVIRAEYNLSRNVSIVAIRDQNGVVSFDVKIRRRKR